MGYMLLYEVVTVYWNGCAWLHAQFCWDVQYVALTSEFAFTYQTESYGLVNLGGLHGPFPPLLNGLTDFSNVLILPCRVCLGALLPPGTAGSNLEVLYFLQMQRYQLLSCIVVYIYLRTVEYLLHLYGSLLKSVEWELKGYDLQFIDEFCFYTTLTRKWRYFFHSQPAELNFRICHLLQLN